jgi:hypothetical protein
MVRMARWVSAAQAAMWAMIRRVPVLVAAVVGSAEGAADRTWRRARREAQAAAAPVTRTVSDWPTLRSTLDQLAMVGLRCHRHHLPPLNLRLVPHLL